MTAYTYTVRDAPKAVKEALSIAQVRIRRSGIDLHRVEADCEILQRFINECDRKRPVGPDGKHGDLHTDECGCDES